MRLLFSSDDIKNCDWGITCGPSALAVACDLHFDSVKDAVHMAGFSKDKGHMSPTMMKAALDILGVSFSEKDKNRKIGKREMFKRWPKSGLMRVQWDGPWYGRMAYRHTHWVAIGNLEFEQLMHVFDINAGLNLFSEWERSTVPMIIENCCPKEANGEWFPTHIWSVG